MTKRLKLEIVVITVLLCFAGAQSSVFAKWSELDEISTLIEQHYPKDVGDQQIVDGACDGVLKSLDPYSEYLTQKEFQEIKNEVQGNYGGVGIVIAMRGDYPKVVKVLKGSPAETSGVHELDEIVAVDGISCFRNSIFHVVEEMRGPVNSEVALTLKRQGAEAVIDLKLKRAKIVVESVRESRVLAPGVGYIKLVEFVDNSAADLDKALGELKKSRVNFLILDLRNNMGGTLDSAVQIANKFLPAGALIAKTEGKNPEDNGSFYADSHGADTSLPMMVLVNRYTASASEIVAGTLKDNHRAKVIGEKTFGKGSVQTIYPLTSGAGVRMTTAHYVLPGGQIIDHAGIQPDIVVPFPDDAEQMKELADKKDSILDKTLEIVNGTKTQK